MANVLCRSNRFFKIFVLAAVAAVGVAYVSGAHQRRPRSERRIILGKTQSGALYATTVALKDLSALQTGEAVQVSIADAQGVVAGKRLHSQDLDFYVTLRARKHGVATVTLRTKTGADVPEITTSFVRIPEGKPGPAVIAAMPNDTWQAAQPFNFGQTIFGSSDERPYAPGPDEDAYAALVKGFQWFKFTFTGSAPALAYFVLDITDREVPLDVDVFTLGKDAQGQADVIPYGKGSSIYQIEATQNYPGLYKFRTRILDPGQTYYVRVAADHPSYQLRTFSYPVPAYSDARQAIRTGMDFLINMGDSWLSNTPRRGAIALRTTMNHADTQQCIACHPTQFTSRGYLTAISHGYPPTQRPALEFITDRIYNNQRPLYGEPGTDWVRVIYSARTVASRLPLIENLYESNVTHDTPRVDNFERPYANFLKIHYKDRHFLPGDETDGCEPDVSAFEIATQSWETFNLLYKQTQNKEWQDQRDMVEGLAVRYRPQNIVDLNWKIQFLATVDRERFKGELDDLIAQLYSYEQPNGMWAYAFDKNGKPADFVSYNAVLAVAIAGRRPENDSGLRLAVDAMLKAQRPEGSWEGDPVYQGFNTPFRATQFAVMALSTLYPGPDEKSSKDKRWEDAFGPPPITLNTHDLPSLLSQLDQFWDLAPESSLKQIRDVLRTSNQPLAREAAARALGHMADPGSVKTLTAALGDPSKMVQRSAAWALRMILERRPSAEAREELSTALASKNARVRWGATQLFNQHFKYLADDASLRTAFTRDLEDPVPSIRLNTARGLWQWSYWSADDAAARKSVLTALASRLNTEQDATVRRAVHESIYDVLDENTGYLEAWVRATATDQDQKRIHDGYEAVVRDQAQVLAEVLRTGTPLGRRGVLESMWDFHIRHYSLPQLKKGQVAVALPAVFTKYVSGVPDLHREGYEYTPYRDTGDFRYDVHNGFFQTRIGNDSDLIHFFESSGPELEKALIACLKNADSDTKIDVLKAGSTLSGAGDAEFAKAALQLALDPNKEVRETVSYVYENNQRGVLNINKPGLRPDPELVSIITRILESPDENAQATVLPLLAALPTDSPWVRQPEIMTALRALLAREPRVNNYGRVLTAAAAFPDLMEEPKIREQVSAALQDPAQDVQRAAIQIALERLNNPREAEANRQLFDNLGSSQRTVMIEEVNDPKFLLNHFGVSGGAVSQDRAYFLGGGSQKNKPPELLENPIVFHAVLQSLQDRDANVRAAALDLLRKVKGIERRTEFRAALEQLQSDPNPRLSTIAKNVLGGKRLSEALADVKPGSVLDFNYFMAKIEPILATQGEDGKACVMCHATHVIFRLHPPNAEGHFSPQDSEDNYKYAMRVVDINNPAHSLMLVKPTRPTDSAGNVADYLATHNGGQRWPGNEASWQYKTILQWIRGARLENTTETASK